MAQPPRPAFDPFGEAPAPAPQRQAIPTGVKPAFDPFEDAAPVGGRRPFAAGLEAAKTQLTVGLPYGLQKAGIGELTPEEEADYKARLQESRATQEELLPGGPASWRDIRDVRSASAFITENLAVGAPQMAATALGALGGAAAGSTVAPGPGTVVGGGAGAIASGTPFFVGSNVDAATEGGEKDLLESQAQKSVAVAPAQAALDALIGKFVPGIRGKLPGGVPAPAGGVVARTLKNAGGAAVTEGATETLQQVGERFAAEKSLTDAEARREYMDAGITGGAIGGTIGAATGPFSGRTESNFDPEAATGDVASIETPDPEVAAPPASGRPPIERGTQGDLFSLDDVLDRGIDPVETAGDEQAVSEKGAVGAFQLLPSTAKSMAARLGIKFDEARLRKDKAYNRTLAREYLRTLVERYDGDMFLAVTAYHAGEGNVDSWTKRFGYDPANRQAFVDQIAKVGNPRSAAYPMKVLAAMGRSEFGQATDIEEFSLPAQVDDFDLTQGSIMAQLRNATLNDAGVAAPADAQMLALSNKLSQSLNAADIDGATKAVERQKAKLAKDVETLAEEQSQLSEGKAQHTPEEQQRYQADLDAKLSKLIQRDKVIDAADALIQRVTAVLNTSQPDLFSPAPETVTQPEPPAAAAAPQALNIVTEPEPFRRFDRRQRLPAEPQPSLTPPAAETRLAQDMAVDKANEFSANTEARVGLLDAVLSDPTTRNPLSRFVARLKRVGLDPTPTAAEIETITAFENRFEPSGPDESGNFGIPERKTAAIPTAAEPQLQAAPEPVAAAAPEPEIIEGNVRTRATAFADTLGSSRRAWFLKGVDSELGATDTPAPTSKSKATWFEEGRAFVRQENENQARERGSAAAPAKPAASPVDRKPTAAEPSKTRSQELKERAAAKAEPKAAEKPVSRGGKKAFDEAVARAEQQGKIDSRAGMALRAMADASWDQDMWTALDTAVADAAGAPPARSYRVVPRVDSDGPRPIGFKELKAAWQRVMRTRLDQLGLQDVNLFVTNADGISAVIGSDGVAGTYTQYKDLGHVVDVAFDLGDPSMTLDHEAIHALRNMNLFTDKEWQTLVRHFEKDPDLKKFANQPLYAELSPEARQEEMVAEGFARWVADRQATADFVEANGTTVNRLLWKVYQFLGAVADFFRGLGFDSSMAVKRAIDSGEIGARARGMTRQDMLKGQRARSFRKIQSEPVEKASRAIGVSLKEAAKKGHAWAVFTEDLANMARDLLPSAKRLIDLHSRNFALSRDFEERLLEVKKAYEALPQRLKGTGKGSISEFLYDSRMAGKWGFKPSWQSNAEVDAGLARRFEALPKAAQDVVKAIFRFNHDARNQLYKATISAINAEYDPLIEAAEGDTAKAEMEASKARALAHFSRVFDTRDGAPYTPLKREGRWAVVGRSAEYLAAKQAGDRATMDKLRSEPEHYFVDFRDTAAEAEALSRNVATKFGKDGTSYFERSEVTDADIGGAELHMAFQQLKAAVEGELKATGSKAAKELHRLATDLYLHTLSDTSARKGELSAELVSAKDPVTGEVMDMVKAFVSRGQATTHYIASVSNNAEIQKTLKAMREELSQVEGPKRTDAARFYNELVWRYVTNLGHKPSRFVDQATRLVSVWNLLLSPFYYLQNATQAVLLSQPLIAARTGYGRATAEMNRAYADFAKMTANVAITDRVDFKKAPNDVRDVLHRLADRGRLDAGFNMELGSWEANGDGVVSAAWNKIDRFLRMAPQRIEVMNRVVTGIAAYRAGLKSGMSQEDAFEFASKAIYDSHGDYSGFNAPKPFAAMGNWGKVVLQFRKFQFIMASLVAKEFHRTFKGATRAEKLAGAKALAFISAHMAAVGGIVGQPAAALFGPMVMSVLNALDDDDDKDVDDWKEELRKFLGAGRDGEDRNWFADLLFKGAPYALLGMDTSDRLGMGNMLAIAPYSDLDQAANDRDSMYKTFGQLLSGALGGLAGKANDAWAYAREDNMERAVEAILPGVAGSAMKASRLSGEGLTARNGDVLIRPEDVDGLEAFYTAIGVTPSKLADQRERRALAFKADRYYDGKTTNLKRRYTAAMRDGDQDKVAKIREEWAAIQEARVRDGFKRQPLSTLMRAPAEQTKREAGVVGGVPTTSANRGYVQSLADETE